MPSVDTVLTDRTIGVSEFKTNPANALAQAGEVVAVLSHNRALGYFVSPRLFSVMRLALDRLEDLEDAELAANRWEAERNRAIPVNLADL